MAAAAALYESGVTEILLLEREPALGGVLRQCIHDGFGLTRFQQSLTGPEYAQRFIQRIESLRIPYKTNAMVLSVSPDKTVTWSERDGIMKAKAKAVLFAMGCRERTRGMLALPGTRPAGVLTAGTAQAYMNLYNRMIGKEIVILGSGDIGLIMARRLTLEGAHVKGVFEIQLFPSGLPRNITQCLEDFDLPLRLRHTVTEIHGAARVEGVTVSQVDEHLHPIPGTEEYIPCDTVILSVGLIPANDLGLDAGMSLDSATKGAFADEFCQTNLPGIFSAGNVLHVHDLVDDVSLEAEKAADGIRKYVRDGTLPECPIHLIPGRHVGQVFPQIVSGRNDVSLSLRTDTVMENTAVTLTQNGRVILRKEYRKLHPAVMIHLDLPAEKVSGGDIEVSIG